MTNWTALFFACISLISRSKLVSLIIVGANTTAKFLGVIYGRVSKSNLLTWHRRSLPNSRSPELPLELSGISGTQGNRDVSAVAC